jgi:cellulose synthase/poly-beta-1,6-N-acetylglucosamine synthase-like glycosyltransferase
MRNNNTNTKAQDMKYNTRVNHLTTHEIVASKIEKGLTNEIHIICEIAQILRDMGKNHTQVKFLMNGDNDFITDVLGCYDSDNTPPFDNFHPLNATKISPRWADGSKR